MSFLTINYLLIYCKTYKSFSKTLKGQTVFLNILFTCFTFFKTNVQCNAILFMLDPLRWMASSLWTIWQSNQQSAAQKEKTLTDKHNFNKSHLRFCSAACSGITNKSAECRVLILTCFYLWMQQRIPSMPTLVLWPANSPHLGPTCRWRTWRWFPPLKPCGTRVPAGDTREERGDTKSEEVDGSQISASAPAHIQPQPAAVRVLSAMKHEWTSLCKFFILIWCYFFS